MAVRARQHRDSLLTYAVRHLRVIDGRGECRSDVCARWCAARCGIATVGAAGGRAQSTLPAPRLPVCGASPMCRGKSARAREPPGPGPRCARSFCAPIGRPTGSGATSAGRRSTCRRPAASAWRGAGGATRAPPAPAAARGTHTLTHRLRARRRTTRRCTGPSGVRRWATGG